MPTIIRAVDAARGVQGTAFNFEDMAAKADDYLDRVRREAARIVADAKEQARQQATAQAAAVRCQAESEGRQAAIQSHETMVAARLADVLGAMRKAVADIEDAKQAWLRHWERSAVHLAAAIARRVIRRELTRQPDIPVALVREALELAAGSSLVRVHLNPQDHGEIAGQLESITRELATLTKAEIVADANISPGGCRVETQFGIIDQQIDAQLARIEEELT